MLAIIAAIVFGIGFFAAAFLNAVPQAVVPGFLYLGGFFLALHLLWPYSPWHRQP
jgi:hypothetical protein